MAAKKNILKDLFSKHMLIILFLGFASGLPLALTGGTLKTWLAREQVDISTIGYFSWVGLSYSLKFLWSPLLDRYTLFKVGRRRSWMMATQVAIMASLLFLGTLSPMNNLSLMAIMAVLIAFFSATQDIAIDAYRREILTNQELGLGSSLNIYGYRIAMLVSGGLGIGMVGNEFWPITWGQLYFLMAAIMGIGLLTTFFAPEPKLDSPPPKSLYQAAVEPFAEFLRRPGAAYILLFVLLFKLGDALAGALLQPFYVQMGFTNADIGLVAKVFGTASSLVGLFFGGIAIYYIGIYRSLWVFGILQAISTAAFAVLTFTGNALVPFAAVIVFEDISTGMATAAFVAFMAALSNKKYTATQYAILSSVATLGRTFFSGFTGDLVKQLGWANFFYACALIAIPGLLMLIGMKKYHTDEALDS
ncbi:AmpG family muropeptide MFS transporter [Bdellovibrio sp. KM01]|uniref:AmpG family muropeptide MFS transporter n=1 Tax=Bdellovibrio sp. KM01 TaxID=2748865 RepID=UPI001C6840F9|nr:AmpG family muropeptide MFS transporter [Bdellovibrio sp. KM01]